MTTPLGRKALPRRHRPVHADYVGGNDTMWVAVRQRFQRFHEELNISTDDYEDGIGKAVRVTQALERAYNAKVGDQPPLLIVGSWGKRTQVRPSGDIDIMVEFNWSVYRRFEDRAGNKQSQFLQEVKLFLSDAYPQTDMRGDGQVVVVGFNSIVVEVVPVFKFDNGNYLMPDSNNGGRWKVVDPSSQIAIIEDVDARTNGNTRALTKMIKLWKRERNVSIKSFIIELLVAEFMSTYSNATYSYLWYDYFVRDFFRFLTTQAWRRFAVPGTNDFVDIGADWLTKAETALQAALRACNWEYHDYDVTAGQEWQTIFGNRIQTHVL